MGRNGAMPTFKTIDDYIEHQSEKAQFILHQLRQLIKETVPKVVEIPNSKVPSFILVEGAKPVQQLMIVAYAKYVSFYPYETTVKHFAEDLRNYDLGKGTVKFEFDKPLPNNLIKQMIIFRKNELENNMRMPSA